MELPADLLNNKKTNKASDSKANPKATSSKSNTETSPKRQFFKSKKLVGDTGAYGTGRRKNSIARVWLKPGSGKVTINKRDVNDYFAREYYRTVLMSPLTDTETHKQYDVVCTATGGGTTGQAGAIRHGIARALDCLSEDFHKTLRAAGHLTRDSRIVERKKPGLRKARRRRQFSKR